MIDFLVGMLARLLPSIGIHRLITRSILTSTAAKPRIDVDGCAPPPVTQFSHEEEALKNTGQLVCYDD